MASECEGPVVMVYITHNARLGVLAVIVSLGAAGVLAIVSLGALAVMLLVGGVKVVRHERGRLRLHARFLRPLKPTRSSHQACFFVCRW